MAIFKQSQKSNKIEFRHAVNGILFLVTCLFEWNHIQVVKTLGKVLFETAKTGNSRSVSIAHTQPAAPKLERGGATLARALDGSSRYVERFTRESSFIVASKRMYSSVSINYGGLQICIMEQYKCLISYKTHYDTVDI